MWNDVVWVGAGVVWLVFLSRLVCQIKSRLTQSKFESGQA